MIPKLFKCRVDQYQNGEWVNISKPYPLGWVTTAEVQIGGLIDTQVGTLFPSATGTIVCHSPPEGRPKIDINPAAPVRIYWDDELLWEGWSTGAIESYNQTNQNTIVLPCIGALAYMEQYYPKLYALLEDDEIDVGTAVRKVLDAIGWPESKRSIDDGITKVLTGRLNARANLNQGRRRSKISDALLMLAQAEAGRIYDDEQGRVVFENRRRRRIPYSGTGYQHTLDNTIPELSWSTFDVQNRIDQIINVIEGEGDNFVSAGEQDIHFDPPLSNLVGAGPGDYILEPQLQVKAFGLISRLDTSPAFYTGWKINITSTPNNDMVGSIVVTPTEGEYLLTLASPSSLNEKVASISIRATPFKVTNRNVLTVRSNASIQHYGERIANYPADLVGNLNDSQFDELHDHLLWALHTSDGVDENGNKQSRPQIVVGVYDPPIRQVGMSTMVRISPRQGGFNNKISNTAFVTSRNFEDGADDPHLYFVDGIKYTADDRGVMMAEYSLTNSHQYLYWDRSRFTIGIDTKAGF